MLQSRTNRSGRKADATVPEAELERWLAEMEVQRNFRAPVGKGRLRFVPLAAAVALAGLLGLTVGCNRKGVTADVNLSANGCATADKLFAAFRDVTDPELQAVVNRTVLRLRAGQSGKGIPELQTLARLPGLSSEQRLLVDAVIRQTTPPEMTFRPKAKKSL